MIITTMPLFFGHSGEGWARGRAGGSEECELMLWGDWERGEERRWLERSLEMYEIWDMAGSLASKP